ISIIYYFFFSSRRRHTRSKRDWSSDVCSSDLAYKNNQKLPRLNENLKLEETVLCLNHRWLLENSLVNKEAMERLVKRVRGTRTYGSAALEFAYVAEGILG